MNIKVSINLRKDFILFPHRKQNTKCRSLNERNRANGNQFQISKRFCAKSDPGVIFKPIPNANFFRPVCTIFDIRATNPLSSIVGVSKLTFGTNLILLPIVNIPFAQCYELSSKLQIKYSLSVNLTTIKYHTFISTYHIFDFSDFILFLIRLHYLDCFD